MTSARITYCETQWVLKFYTSQKILYLVYLPKTDFWLRPWRSRLFAVKPCRCWSLFVADSRRGAVTTLAVFRQRCGQLFVCFPLPTCSRGQSLTESSSSVCRRAQSFSHGSTVFPVSCRGQSLSWNKSVRLVARPSSSPWRESEKQFFSVIK